MVCNYHRYSHQTTSTSPEMQEALHHWSIKAGRLHIRLPHRPLRRHLTLSRPTRLRPMAFRLPDAQLREHPHTSRFGASTPYSFHHPLRPFKINPKMFHTAKCTISRWESRSASEGRAFYPTFPSTLFHNRITCSTTCRNPALPHDP